MLAIPVSLFVTDAYVAKVGVAGDNIKTSLGANVISMVISPYKLACITLVDVLPPKIPYHCWIV